MLALADQIRAARAMLRLDQEVVATRAHISIATLRRIEQAGAEAAKVSPSAVAGVRHVLEQAGAEFIPDGVRRRKTRDEAASIYRALDEISLRSARRLDGCPAFTEADLYDENGLPA